MSEHVSITEELRARIEELTRERDGARESVVDTLLERERLREASARYKRERDEARANCPDCAMWAERSARWHDDMGRAVKERDEAREEVEKLSESAKSAWEAECIMRGQRDAALEEVVRWKAQHLESQHNGAREAIARKSAEAEVERLKVERDEAREKVQSRGRKAISPQELNAVVAALHDALLSTPRPNTDALRPRLGWPRRKTYAVVREAVRLGMIERVGVYRWTWFRMPFRRSDKP